jgi:hypothetical protein
MRLAPQAVECVQRDADIARPQGMPTLAVRGARRFHLSQRMQREGARTLEPTWVAAAPVQREQGIAVTGRAVAQPGAPHSASRDGWSRSPSTNV